MARTKLNPISVYATDEQLKMLKRAADLEHRSLSNFLLSQGLEKAREMGILPFGLDKKGNIDQKTKATRKRTTGRRS